MIYRKDIVYRVVLVLGIILVGIGLVAMMIQGYKNYELIVTKGKVVDIVDYGEDRYSVTVRYSVGGENRDGILDYYNDDLYEGKEIEIGYDEKDFNRVSYIGDDNDIWYLLSIIGIICLIVYFTHIVALKVDGLQGRQYIVVDGKVSEVIKDIINGGYYVVVVAIHPLSNKSIEVRSENFKDSGGYEIGDIVKVELDIKNNKGKILGKNSGGEEDD